MAIQILEIEQNTEEWHRARENRATGSIADILLTKGLDEALKQNFKQFRGNYYTQRGHILEDEAIELYNEIYGTIAERPGFVINDDFPNAGCSPDGTDKGWLLEVKAFNEKRHLSITKISEIPYKIMAQIQFNMMISGLVKARLIMYNPDVEDPTQAFCVIEVKADPKIQQNFKLKLGVA